VNYKNKKIIKNKLFPFNGDNEIWNKVLIDDETVSYISTPYDAERITKIIEQHCLDEGLELKNLSITDATAGAGGNVLSFAKKFKLVNAIEFDVKRYNFLINNIVAYKLNNIVSYCDDCLKLIYNLPNQDIIFFDPPWGGKDYKNKINIRLSLSDISIEDICINIFKKVSIDISGNIITQINNNSPKLVALKLPKNYDLLYLYQKLSSEINYVKIFLYSLNKMNIIILAKQKIN
jgi:16S rRNA G966 N2-methylase RsmD